MRRGGRGFGGGGLSRPLHHPQMNIPRQLQPPQTQFGASNNSALLMTDHLQGLKDIDMELELLKRKREIIEQQQQMLSNSYRQRNDFEQSYSQPRESRYVDDYTALYEEPRNELFGRGESRKRVHSIPVWESDAAEPPKRFSGASRGSRLAPQSGPRAPPSGPRAPPSGPRAPPARLEPRSERPEPRFPAPKPYKRAAPPARKPNKDFNPSRVSKPSAPPPPALARYEPAERKRLVTEARVHTDPSKELDFWLVRADREPNPKLNGRLELALGAIMKDVKLANPQHERLFKAPLSTRTMKAAVRERIRAVMVGKHADTIDNIKAAYYSAYPCRKHDYVVMQGLDVQRDRDGKVFVADSDDPEEFFKTNMQYLMTKKMDEMIKQLQLIYSSDSNVPPPRYSRPRQRGAKNQAKNTETNQEDNKPKSEENQTQPQEVKTETQTAEQTDISEPKQEKVEIKVEENPTSKEVTEEDNPAKLSAEEEEARNLILKFVNDKQYIALDKLMTHKMLHLLRTHTPEIVKTMEMNKTYRQMKIEVMNMTKAKLTKVYGKDETTIYQSTGDQAQSTPPKPAQEKRGPPLHFVKIFGKPSLPKRKAMEIFFKVFQPRTIKKHKTIHNLLFVGFSDKESYDKILAADGTAIGRYVLDIKVSERNIKPNNNTSQNSIITLEDDENLNKSIEIGSDLDSQITDLLSSIRNSEFEADGDKASLNDIDPQPDEVKNDNITAENKEITNVDSENAKEVKNQEDDEDLIQFDDVPKENGGTVETQNEVGAIETQDKVNAVEKQNVAQTETNEVVKDDTKPENGNTNKEVEVNEEKAEKKDEVAELKTAAKEVPRTPTRASARLAAPGGINTRRMSRLAE